MNKLSIEGLYYLIKLIKILINQNHFGENSKKQKHNYHNTYIMQHAAFNKSLI